MAELRDSSSSGALHQLADDEGSSSSSSSSSSSTSAAHALPTSPRHTPSSPRSAGNSPGPSPLFRPVRVICAPDVIERYQHEAFSDPRHRLMRSDYRATHHAISEWRMKERVRPVARRAPLFPCSPTTQNHRMFSRLFSDSFALLLSSLCSQMRTVSVALVACLNIGVDPPDVVKPQPCARLECWADPLAMPPQKALDTIGNTLQLQYERWQPRVRDIYS